MCNLICQILEMPAYESPINHSDAVIEPLSRCLHPMILHHMISMLMDAVAILLEMQT